MKRRADGVLGVLLAAAVSLAGAVPAAGDTRDEETRMNVFVTALGWLTGLEGKKGGFITVRPFSSRAAATVPNLHLSEVYALDNFNATTEAGEPTDGGRIKRTMWARFTPDVDARIVIDTFGSDFDTSLVAFTGSAVNALSFVAGNYNTAVPGLSSGHSLIAFNVLADTRYNIQIGSETGAEGDIIAHAYAFPPGGGLAVSLATVGGFPRLVGDFECGYRALILLACGNPKFILYNGTNSTLTITPASDLGTGVTAPAPFALPPGAVTTAEFTFTGAFDTTTPRTVSGQFTFTGTANGQIVSIGQHKALIVVKPSGALPDVIRYSVVPFVRAVAINEDAAFDVIVTNTGGGDAIGCHVRGSINRATLTHWQLIEPVSGFGAAAHPRDAPFTIPAGQSRLVRVTRASQQSRIASPDFAGTNTAIVDCANTQFAPQNLSNNFDFTARGLYDPADVAIFSSIPGTGTLDVPAGSYSSFYVWFVNRGPTAQFVVTPHYLRPFDESDPAKQFLTSLCTANRFGECTSSPAFSSTFTAEQNVRHIYKIYVQAPPVDPGYDPGLRRILFKINQVQPVGFVFSVPVAAHSVAVRRN